MSNGLDLQNIRENYERMSDEKLIHVATQNASGLVPEAQEIVKAEIVKRKLDINLINSVQAQNKSLTLEEIDEYCNLFRNLNCPLCGSGSVLLNATKTSEVISFIFFTHRKIEIIVACPTCLDKANNKAILKTVFLGWWGIPWGVIRTPQAILQNMNSKKTNSAETSNNYLRSFVSSKIGLFETYRNNREELQRIISKK